MGLLIGTLGFGICYTVLLQFALDQMIAVASGMRRSVLQYSGTVGGTILDC